MNPRPLYLALILASVQAAAHAQYVKCKDANGRYTVQNTPCAPDPRAPDRKRPKVGDRDDSVNQRNKNDKPDANWEPRSQTAQESHISPPQAASPAQAHAGKPPKAAPAGQSWQDKEQAYQQRRAEEAKKAVSDQGKANDRQRECNRARQQLAVLSEIQPVYSRANNGEKKYVSDENRPAHIATARQRVADACR